MSTPTKFNQGGVPRTRTGLVPTSYTRTLDNLTFQLEELPTKPPQPKYKYRGDYVNERNRKIVHERKLAQKQRQQSLLDRSKRSEKSVDSFGSTINSSTDNTNKDDKPPTPKIQGISGIRTASTSHATSCQKTKNCQGYKTRRSLYPF